MNDAESIAGNMLDAVKGYVSRVKSALDLRLDELDSRIKAIPSGAKGDKGEPGKDAFVDESAIVERVKSLIPIPKNGDNGKDGKGAYQLAVERGFTGTELQWLDSLQGKNGKDAVVDYDRIGTAIKEVVAVAVAEIPPAKDGINGKDGRDGVDGKDGLPGERGEKGEPGEHGINGKDADPEIMARMIAEGIAKSLPDAVDAVVKGLLPEIIQKAAERVPAGKDGEPGRDGKDAEPVDFDAVVSKAVSMIPAPKDGENGKSVTLDEVRPILEAETARWQLEFERRAGDVIRDAVVSEVKKIDPPKDGEKGEPGRDALDIVILPGIDETKSYPAGTWARYCGGLIRATRKTDPVKDSLLDSGWDVIVEGISAVAVTQGENLRSFSVGAIMTSGTKAVSEFSVPVQIYRGVYRAGKYEKADTVTFGGGTWIALRDTTTKPPSDDWQLCVARGKDGKDAE